MVCPHLFWALSSLQDLCIYPQASKGTLSCPHFFHLSGLSSLYLMNLFGRPFVKCGFTCILRLSPPRSACGSLGTCAHTRWLGGSSSRSISGTCSCRGRNLTLALGALSYIRSKYTDAFCLSDLSCSWPFESHVEPGDCLFCRREAPFLASSCLRCSTFCCGLAPLSNWLLLWSAWCSSVS